MSRITRVRLPPLSRSLRRTLPTDTPAIRTSAASASVAASGKLTRSSYLFAFSGTAPPNDIHRNSSSTKQPRAKMIIVGMRITCVKRSHISFISFGASSIPSPPRPSYPTGGGRERPPSGERSRRTGTAQGEDEESEDCRERRDREPGERRRGNGVG